MIDCEAAYARWRGPLMARCRNLTHVVEPEDLVQDLFVELIANGATPDKALLFWVLHRRVIDAQRHARRRPTEMLDRVMLAIEGPDVDRVAAAELLLSLPLLPRERIIFRLAAAGYEQEDIAAVLGTTKGAINAAAVRARKAAAAHSCGEQRRSRQRGVCAHCDRPADGGLGMCQRHYKQDWMRRRREAAGDTP